MGRIIYDAKLNDEKHRLWDYLISRGFTLWDMKLLLMKVDNHIDKEIISRKLEVKKK